MQKIRGWGGVGGLEIRPVTSYYTIFTISTTPYIFPEISFIATPTVRRLTSVHTFTGTLTAGAAVPDQGGAPSRSHLKWVTSNRGESQMLSFTCGALGIPIHTLTHTVSHKTHYSSSSGDDSQYNDVCVCSHQGNQKIRVQETITFSGGNPEYGVKSTVLHTWVSKSMKSLPMTFVIIRCSLLQKYINWKKINNMSSKSNIRKIMSRQHQQMKWQEL